MTLCSSRYYLGPPWVPEIVSCAGEAGHGGLHGSRLVGETNRRTWNDLHAIGGARDRQTWRDEDDLRPRLPRRPGPRRRPRRP